MEKVWKAIPLALISKDKTSTGYNAWRGVNPIEYRAPKIKMKARHAVPDCGLVPGLVSLPPCLANSELVTVTQTQTMAQAVFEKSKSGRRPTRSTSVEPKMANRNCWQELIRITFPCGMVPEIPALSKTVDMK